MTEEEAYEYNRLVGEFNRLVAENEALANQLRMGIQNCIVLSDNISKVGKQVTNDVSIVSGEVSQADEIVEKLSKLLIDVTEDYFLFKNVSEATKMLTKYNNEYYTRFHFYNELRRITLGFVVGLDAHIVSSEVLRKKVEKAYLANTDYWLAYAIASVMLWASDEKEAAYRAMKQSMLMDGYRSCIFYMLINLRFARVEVARNWFITLLDKSDVNNLSEEWQHVLHSYLIGALRNDRELYEMAESYFTKMLEQTYATSANYGKKVSERGYSFTKSFISVTEKRYTELSALSPDYKEMIELLSDMEKIGLIAEYFDKVYRMEDNSGENIREQVENILYDLIKGYDDEEFKIVKSIKYNESVVSARGDMKKANARFKDLYGKIGEKKTFGDLLLLWAFSDDYTQTHIVVKRFALSHLKEGIKNGVSAYFEERIASLREKYRLVIPTSSELEPFEIECSENSYDEAAAKMGEFFNKNRVRYVFNDKYFKIFLIVCAAAVLVLAVGGLAVETAAFPALLTIGIITGIAGGFLVWRRWVDRSAELKEKHRMALARLRNSIQEIEEWCRSVKEEAGQLEDLKNAIDMF